MGRNRINEPLSTGVATRSSTGWFGIDTPEGFEPIHRLFGSSLRAAEWASDKFGKPWPELHALGFTVRGGYQASDAGEQK
jgi:hypothetical protein